MNLASSFGFVQFLNLIPFVLFQRTRGHVRLLCSFFVLLRTERTVSSQDHLKMSMYEILGSNEIVSIPLDL